MKGLKRYFSRLIAALLATPIMVIAMLLVACAICIIAVISAVTVPVAALLGKARVFVKEPNGEISWVKIE